MAKSFFSGLISAADFLSEKSGVTNLAAAFIARLQARKQANAWVPRDFEPSTKINPELLKTLLIHLHVYHESYIPQATKIIADFPDAGGILITSPFEKVLSEFDSTSRGSNLELRLVKNIGRNFGAIKQILPTIGTFKYLLHLHTKASKHMSSRRVAEWSQSFWGRLASRDTVLRILSAMDSNAEITISYPELTAILPSSAYRWGGNKKLAESLLASGKLDLLGDQIAFPAGGMFICQSPLILDLLNRLGLEDFPQEPLPLDGSIAHALERLMGVYSLDGAPVHLVLTSQGLLTTDTSFKSFKGIWG